MAMATMMSYGHVYRPPLCPYPNYNRKTKNTSSLSSSPIFFNSSSLNRSRSLSLVVTSALKDPSHLFSYSSYGFLPRAFAAERLSLNSSVPAMERSADSAAAAAAATTVESIGGENLVINILGIAAFAGVIILSISLLYVWKFSGSTTASPPYKQRGDNILCCSRSGWLLSGPDEHEVVYLAVNEFLEKRRRDEETKKLIEESKNTKKKKVSIAEKRGPKGFGKKLQDFD